ALLLSIGLVAQQGPGPKGPHQQGADGPQKGNKLTRCLTIVDLSEDQKTQIQEIFEAAKPDLEALREEAKADHQALRDAIDSGADDCTVGSTLLEVHANREEMRAFREQIRDDVFGVLTTDQQLKLSGCLEAPGRGRRGPGGPRN
ncbi:MAG: Spy/CpxP family protein refolding chaperone, partial [Thermoanaerobaculia bacterium]|nr:Spy/CpxP family protein refolding chaperone [Thermoanaerobaculia bacterium]